MSETRYKEALNKLDPDVRTAFKHHDRQIKEIRVTPLRSLQELEKKVQTNISKMEKNNKYLENLIAEFQKTADQVEKYTPNFLEKNQEKYLQKMEAMGQKYKKLFEKIFGELTQIYDVYEQIHKIVNADNKKNRKMTKYSCNDCPDSAMCKNYRR